MNRFLHELLNTFLHNQNQFASGGLLLMAVGSILALLRSIPAKIWAWVVHQTTVTMTLTDDTAAFYWLKCWLEEQRIMKRTRHMDVFNRGGDKYSFVPAPGHHWMLFEGRVLSFIFSRSAEAKVNQNSSFARRNESLTFKTIGRKQDVFRKLMKSVYQTHVDTVGKNPKLFVWGGWGDWTEIHAYQPRPLKSVIIPANDKSRLISNIEDFKNSRDWYRDMGIPYRKGYLFYGPPGTGKTSLVTGLSSHFKADVYILKLADMKDGELCQAAKEVGPNSFIIVEDVDSVSASQDRKLAIKNKGKKDEKGSVTLSGLLNVLDGLLSPNGAIFILTTNHREHLDPALIRKGRIDMELHLTYATEEQKRELYSKFLPGECPQKYINKEMTMAEMQQILMDKRIGDGQAT
jgi:mitochondrial chaperone BCS1